MSFFGKFFGTKASNPDRRKTVNLVEASIRVPEDYLTETDKKGTVILIPHKSSSACIRVSSIFVRAKEGHPPAQLADLVRKDAAKRSIEPEELLDGRVLLTYEQSSVENGTPILLRFWNVGLDDCLTVFSLTIPTSQSRMEEHQNLLTEMRRIIESYERNVRTEILETQSGPVQTTVERDPTPPAQDRQPLDQDELFQLRQQLNSANSLITRYSVPTITVDPTLLDTVFKRWLLDDAADKPSADLVASAIGAAFGNYLVSTLDMHWQKITDEYGAALAVKHQRSSITAFPIETIRKRIESRQTDFIQNVFLTIRHTIESGDYQ